MQPIDTAWTILKDMAGICRACGERNMKSGFCQACGTPSLVVQDKMSRMPPDYKRQIREQMGTADDDEIKSIPRGPNEMRALAPIEAARDFVNQYGDSTGPMKAHADRVERELMAFMQGQGPAPRLPTMEQQAGRQEYGGNMGAPEGMTPENLGRELV